LRAARNLSLLASTP